jgi:hypothetical protein
MDIAWFCRMRRAPSKVDNLVCLGLKKGALQIGRRRTGNSCSLTPPGNICLPLFDGPSQAGLPAPLTLFRRARIGVRFNVASLLVHHAAQFALHRFERVVNHLVERLVRTVVRLPLIGNQLVSTRHSHIDATPVRITFLMGVIGLLDGHIAAIDVVAKFFESRCIIQNEIVDLVRFFQTPIRDLNRQLHDLIR